MASIAPSGMGAAERSIRPEFRRSGGRKSGRPGERERTGRFGTSRTTRTSSILPRRWHRSCGSSIPALSTRSPKTTRIAEWHPCSSIDPRHLSLGRPALFQASRRRKHGDLFRQRARRIPSQCLARQRHLWAFVFTGPFRKQGPDGYQLAHLFDHKEHGNRWRDELDLPPHTDEPAPLYGLFTSAANSVYAPGAFLRPTDFSPRLRSPDPEACAAALRRHMPRRSVTSGGKALRRPELGSRQLPVERARGRHGPRSRFLAFRRERTGELIDKRHAALRIDGSQ